jgi:hypothetical protein
LLSGAPTDDTFVNSGEWAERCALLELLAEHLSERVLLIGPQGTVLASLGRPPGMLGFGADERDGMHVAERIHPDDLPEVLGLLARARVSESLEESSLCGRGTKTARGAASTSPYSAEPAIRQSMPASYGCGL